MPMPTTGAASMSPSLPRLSLDAAREALSGGKLIAFPTETFYGIGCDAMNPDAVAAVFALKRRSLSMPLPVVIDSRDTLKRLARPVVGAAATLMDAFWPGPLSIVLSALPEVPDLLTAGISRVAVRFSPHPAALALCAAGHPVVASSANISGRPPVARPEDLDPELIPGLSGLFTDGPEPSAVLPSTVVDIREHLGKAVVRILRPGAVSRDALEAQGFSVLEKIDPPQ